MILKSMASAFVAAAWLAAGTGALAQSGEQQPGRAATPGMGPGMQSPEARGPMGEQHGQQGRHGQGPMSGRMMEGGMMGRGMMGGHMAGGHMAGGCPMMGMLPPGNEQLSMKMHGEIMVAIGNILMKHADSIQAKPKPAN